jgi:hypothetical protein
VSNRAAPAVTGPSMLDLRLFTLELVVFNAQNITIISLVCCYFATDVENNGLCTLIELRTELQKRGAKLAGRKHELVEGSVSSVYLDLYCLPHRLTNWYKPVVIHLGCNCSRFNAVCEVVEWLRMSRWLLASQLQMRTFQALH